MLPTELQSLLDQIDACEADAEQLVADLDDEGVNWVPPQGGWSIAQCVNHLVLMNPYYLAHWPEEVRKAAQKDLGPFRGLQPTWWGRAFVRWMEPPARMKAKANAATVPGPRFARDTIVPAYRQSHEIFRHLVRASAAVDVNRVVSHNALARQVRMRLSTTLLIVPAHDRRHLWQASNVKKQMPGRFAG